MAEIKPEDADGTDIAPDGRVMEMLSEHTLEGWLEGYILTGRHGFFNTYESFVHIIDSMYNQHAKWLEKSKLEVKWRAPISSLNLLITPTCLAAGSQRFHAPGSRLSGRRQQQERRRDAHLSSARRQLPALVADHCLRSEELRQRDRLRQAAALGLSRYGCRHHPLHQGHRNLGLGQQRRLDRSRTW
jgi:xylulose-5-phosphate/fructose-6-phosphate phosphoketolase